MQNTQDTGAIVQQLTPAKEQALKVVMESVCGKMFTDILCMTHICYDPEVRKEIETAVNGFSSWQMGQVYEEVRVSMWQSLLQSYFAPGSTPLTPALKRVDKKDNIEQCLEERVKNMPAEKKEEFKNVVNSMFSQILSIPTDAHVAKYSNIMEVCGNNIGNDVPFRTMELMLYPVNFCSVFKGMLTVVAPAMSNTGQEHIWYNYTMLSHRCGTPLSTSKILEQLANDAVNVTVEPQVVQGQQQSLQEQVKKGVSQSAQPGKGDF